MRLRSGFLGIRGVLAVALCCPAAALFGQIPQPVPVPTDLPERQQAELAAERSSLLVSARALDQDIEDQKRQCGRVDSADANRVQSCQQWLVRLRARYSEYVNSLARFEQATARHVAIQLDDAILDLLEERRSEVNRQKRRIVAWQTALKSIQRNEVLEGSLADAVRESEEAQQEAIMSSVAYLIGPLSDLIKQAERDGTLAWSEYQRIKPALQKSQEMLDRCRSVWSKHQLLKTEVEQLESELAMAQAVLRTTNDVREVGGVVQKLARSAKAIVAGVDLVRTPMEKQSLLAAMAELQHTSFELLKSSLLDRAIEEAERRGMATVVQQARIAKFIAGYSAAAMKFGIAWGQINEFNDAVADRSRVVLYASIQIRQAEDRRKGASAEAAELSSALLGPAAAKVEVLRVFQARGMVTAYRDGEWFAASTGVRAPGTPIPK